MSNIMKGIVDEGEEVAVIYIDGKPSAKYAKKHEAERDAEFMRSRHPNKKIEIKHEVRETEAKKGADGKRCWKGKRYAGTENGKDKCIPVTEFAGDEKSEQPRQEHPITVYIHSIVDNTTIALIGEKMSELKHGKIKTQFTLPNSGTTYTEWLPVVDKKYPTGKLSSNVNLSSSQMPSVRLNDGVFLYWAYDPQLSEGVIVGHDANDPEVAVLGGAGTMSLSRLKKKAQGEAEQLANDLTRGRFKAAAYNIKQLQNTLNTIVAAEDEMSKKYFGENAWNQLGQRKPNTNLPAPERGSRVNHGRHFEEGDIVLPLSGPLKGQPHKVIHSQRTSIRIVPLGRNTYPGDTIAPRTKHEWVVPADMNEDYTGEFAVEKTPAINPYGGLKDKQHRDAISETPTDNPTGASGEGGLRKYKPKSAGTFKEDTETKWEVAIEYGPTAHHTAKIKVSAPDSETAQSKALAQFKKKFPDRRGMVGDCTKVNEEQLDEKCWDSHKQVGMKKKGDKMVPNCVPKESAIMKGLKR